MSYVAKPGLSTFPVGTTVGAYPVSAWGPGRPPIGGPPVAALEEAVVGSDGTISFDDLAAGTRYRLGASVSGQWRYIDFVAGADVQRHEAERAVLSGALAARPAASQLADGLYFATDDNGGTLYRSDGSSWQKIAPGIDEVAAVALLGYKAVTTQQLTTSASAVDITGLTGMQVTFPDEGAIDIVLDGYFGNDTGAQRCIYEVLDDQGSPETVIAAPIRSHTASDVNQVHRVRRVEAAPGTVRTYRGRFYRAGGTNAIVGSTPTNPTYLAAYPAGATP